MKRFVKNILCWFCILNTVLVFTQTDYHFSNSGNDTNSGTQTNPLKTISKLNSLNLSAGDRVLFKKGDIFVGQIIINHSGAENSPIIYDSYGTGSKPILTASNGDDGIDDPMSTIKIIGKQYLEFHNLKIENERFDTDGNSENDDKSFGFFIRSFLTLPDSKNFEDRNLFKYFRFSNLTLQNIYSLGIDNTTFNNIRTSGIYFWDAFVNDVIIENCHFTNIERTGIWLRRYVSDAIIRNNRFIDIGGSGTIISVSKRVLYDNNIMRFTGAKTDTRMAGRGSGMWVFGSDDVVAQHNISQHSRGAGDSSGMHVDYANTNILYQYNYLEDSAGGFCETLGDNDTIIWRYNISVNEGTEEGGGKNKLLWVNAYAGKNRNIKSKNIFIYNNTIYQGKDYKNTVSDSKIQFVANDINFMNNIIYLESNAKLGIKDFEYNVGTSNFKKNLFFGGTIASAFKSLDASRVEVNPQFTISGIKHFSGYKIKSSSPVKDNAHNFTEPIFPLAGNGIFKNITSKATKDIFGNAVNLSGTTNIGADNGSGVTVKNIITYEAEDSILADGANEINCSNASGGRAVNFQGDNKSITFNTIDVAETTTYLITVYYLNAVKNHLKISVNNNETETILLPATDGYCFQSGNPTSFSVLKKLNVGTNTLKFKNGILDKIEVVSIDNSTLNIDNPILNDGNKLFYIEKTLLRNSENIHVKYYDIDDFKPTKVSVYNINGGVLFRKKYTTSLIEIESNSLGKGLKIVVVEAGSKVLVKKIIIY
tara:strand:+ start:74396 stop:76684 length:2289 start_codon:yes stop_codon:yes gene_type:complete